MNALITGVFKVVAVMMVSLILFSIMFTDTPRKFIFEQVQPVMASTWKDASFDNGKIKTKIWDETFSKAQQIN